jgi:hypothetical protein
MTKRGLEVLVLLWWSQLVTSPLWAQELSFEHLLEIASTVHRGSQSGSFLQNVPLDSASPSLPNCTASLSACFYPSTLYLEEFSFIGMLPNVVPTCSRYFYLEYSKKLLSALPAAENGEIDLYRALYGGVVERQKGPKPKFRKLNH